MAKLKSVTSMIQIQLFKNYSYSIGLRDKNELPPPQKKNDSIKNVNMKFYERNFISSRRVDMPVYFR